MGTSGCAKSLPNYYFYFYHTTFYFWNTCAIFSSKISIFRTPPYRPHFAFCLNPQRLSGCRRRIGVVSFPPGFLSLEISIFRLRFF